MLNTITFCWILFVCLFVCFPAALINTVDYQRQVQHVIVPQQCNEIKYNPMKYSEYTVHLLHT